MTILVNSDQKKNYTVTKSAALTIVSALALGVGLFGAQPAIAEIGVSVGVGGIGVDVGIGSGGSGGSGGGSANVGVGIGGTGVDACVGHCSGGNTVTVGVGTGGTGGGTPGNPGGPSIPGVNRLLPDTPIVPVSAVGGVGRCAGGGNSHLFDGAAVISNDGRVLGWVHDALFGSDNNIEMIKMWSNAKETGSGSCYSVKSAGFGITSRGISTSLSTSNFTR